MEIVNFVGIVGKKSESWRCCMKTSHLAIEATNLLKRLTDKEKNERLIKIALTKIKNKTNWYSVCKEYEKDSKNKYVIIIEKTESDEINPLYIKPFPCKAKEKCENIRALNY